MKTEILFLMIGLMTFGSGASYAQTGDDAKSHQESKSAVHQLSKPAATKKSTHKSIPLPKPAAHPRAPNNEKGSIARNTANARHQVLDRRNGPTTAGVRQSSAVDRARPVRTPAASRSVSSTANNLRHRGANPPTVGGPRGASAGATATLSGSGMSRRR